MKPKKNIFIFIFIVLWCSPLFAGITQVKVLFKEYKTANESCGAIRVTMINESSLDKTGSVEAVSHELMVHFDFTLKPNEKKVYDIPLFLRYHYGSVVVKIGDELEKANLSKVEGKTYENGVLEIKIPGKGQLYLHHNNTDLDTLCVLERIELEELPTNLYCLFQYQVIVIPTEIEASISAEQFQLLKSYLGFGGNILLIDEQGILPARWKTISHEAWGLVTVVKKTDSIDFAEIISKNNIIDPFSGFFKNRSFFFQVPFSSKGIYLAIVLLFIICIGPINYYLLKSRNKTFLIFFTSPIIAIFFSIILTSVFFIKEGFYKHYEGISLTMINPHTHQALINIHNSVYSSNILGKTDRPRNGMYFPVEISSRSNQYNIELADKAYLSGGFSKARTANNYGEIRLVDCNSKINIRFDGDQIYAKNGFGTNQKLIFINRMNKKCYRSNNYVEPDKEVLLQQFTPIGAEIALMLKTTNSFEDILKPFFNNLLSEYVYIASSETNEMVPYREKEGFIQGQNLHLIIGVINK